MDINNPNLFHFVPSSEDNMNIEGHPHWATTVEAHDYNLMIQFSDYEDEHQCPVCERRYWTPRGTPIIRISALTRAWPDFMETPLRTSAFFVSERVLDTLEQESITGYKAVQAKFEEIPPNVPPPGNYYDLQFTTHLKLRDMRDPVKPWSCHFCSAQHNARVMQAVPNHVKWDSWDGTDFILVGRRPRSDLRVSRSVIDLANMHRWTGLKLWASNGEDRLLKPVVEINHLSDRWPPKKWFV